LDELDKRKIFLGNRMISLSKVIEIAFEVELINKKELAAIKNWTRLRNRAVHKYDSIVQRKQAAEIIQGINEITMRLRNL
jgi:uncharacterized protein YutE (UPF0331/DUF86 family)